MDNILNNSKELDVTNELNPDIKYEKKIKARAAAAKVLGITALSITALKVLLCPILAIAVLIFDVAVYFFLMMGGALMLAMTAIVLWFVLPIVILLGLVLIAAIILLELMPVILGIIAALLSSSAKRIARVHEINSPKCKKATSSAKRMSLIGLVVSIVAAPFAAIPTLLLSLPFWFLMIMAVVYLIQLIGLAIA